MLRVQKFYKCNECGNIVGAINNTGIPMYCCRTEMIELIPHEVNSDDMKIQNKITSQLLNSSQINIFPQNIFRVEQDSKENDVSIIIDTDYLTSKSTCWAYLKTQKGGQRKNLLDHDSPTIKFKIIDDSPISAYFYCSDHGLFKKDF